MIGYYVHHVGHGHQHRAEGVRTALDEPTTVFSSLPAPPGWPGTWIQLDRDDDEPDHHDHPDHTAHDRLHWAPLRHRGLRQRMAEIACWIRDVSPSVFVVDVSVEVALLVRLHGVPVVSVAVPGHRGDAAHRLGFDVADAVVGCWPPEATGMLRGVSPGLADRVVEIGALSRFPVAQPGPRRPGPPRVVVFSGTGGHALEREDLEAARRETPEWEWTVLDRELGTWVDDPYPLLLDADVVVTSAGENAVAEVAASRTPAIVVPQPRPHDEQVVTAEALWYGGWPAHVLDAWPREGWDKRLAHAEQLDGRAWESWCDGKAAERLADVVRSVALPEPR
jgi:hypothetical protein